MIQKRDKTGCRVNSSPSISHRQENKTEKHINLNNLTEKTKIINEYYASLSDSGLISSYPYDCFALRLAGLIIAMIQDNENNRVLQGSFEESFFSACVQMAEREGISDQIKDQELLLIYTKQMVLVLRKAGIISVKADKAVVNKRHETCSSLLMDLFDTFWNRCSWGKLFPSDPQAAVELKRHRSILRDIIIAADCKTDIEKISNDFFDLTGFTEKNDLFMISFLDFYIFTWLKHFGLVRYFGSASDSPVAIEVTRTGKIFFSHFPEVQ